MMKKSQSGVALLAVIFFLVVIGFVGIIFISLSSSNTTQSVNEVNAARALYIADGGLERAGRYLLKREGTPPCTTCTCASINTSPLLFANQNLGSGQFTVTSSLSNTFPPTTLSALTPAGANTLPAVSVVGYAPFGRVMIDKEMVNYTSLGGTAAACSPYAAPCFAGAVRGADGTSAAAHSLGTRVAQFQCQLTSTGGVPAISAGSNQRVASQADVLQDGWTVGVSVGGRPAMMHWDGTSWTNTTASAPVLGPGINLTSVSMVSPADGWAVSDSAAGQFSRWNGSNWSLVLPSAVQPLNSIYMNAANDGWAVGNPGVGGQRPLIYYWNGISWTIRNAPLNINRILQSVYCNTNLPTITCWAVGNPGNAAQRPLILYWNGATWQVRNTGLPSINFILRSVSCNSLSVPLDCWAVGDPGGGGQQPLILYWNGAASSWSVRNNGLPVINQTLSSVNCINSNDCWAVGANAGGGTPPVMVHWNGAAWSNWTAAAPVAGVNLNSVTMLASDDAWAVSSTGQMIHWNGAVWSLDAQGTAQSGGNIRYGGLMIGPKKPVVAWQEVVQ